MGAKTKRVQLLLKMSVTFFLAQQIIWVNPISDRVTIFFLCKTEDILQCRNCLVYLKCLDMCKRVFFHGRRVFGLLIIRIKSETGLFFFVSWLMAGSPENFAPKKNPNRCNFYVPKLGDTREKRGRMVPCTVHNKIVVISCGDILWDNGCLVLN
jgi:hypothetical protein